MYKNNNGNCITEKYSRRLCFKKSNKNIHPNSLKNLKNNKNNINEIIKNTNYHNIYSENIEEMVKDVKIFCNENNRKSISRINTSKGLMSINQIMNENFENINKELLIKSQTKGVKGNLPKIENYLYLIEKHNGISIDKFSKLSSDEKLPFIYIIFITLSSVPFLTRFRHY